MTEVPYQPRYTLNVQLPLNHSVPALSIVKYSPTDNLTLTYIVLDCEPEVLTEVRELKGVRLKLTESGDVAKLALPIVAELVPTA